MAENANIIEAGLWVVVAVVFLMRGLRPGRGQRRAAFALAAFFAVFALSDLAESRTGAWWRPWWLLAWKAAAAAAILLALRAYLPWRTIAFMAAAVVFGAASSLSLHWSATGRIKAVAVERRPDGTAVARAHPHNVRHARTWDALAAASGALSLAAAAASVALVARQGRRGCEEA